MSVSSTNSYKIVIPSNSMIDGLPIDIQTSIFCEFSDMRSTKLASLVNKQWFNLINSSWISPDKLCHQALQNRVSYGKWDSSRTVFGFLFSGYNRTAICTSNGIEISSDHQIQQVIKVSRLRHEARVSEHAQRDSDAKFRAEGEGHIKISLNVQRENLVFCKSSRWIFEPSQTQVVADFLHIFDFQEKGVSVYQTVSRTKLLRLSKNKMKHIKIDDFGDKSITGVYPLSKNELLTVLSNGIFSRWELTNQGLKLLTAYCDGREFQLLCQGSPWGIYMCSPEVAASVCNHPFTTSIVRSLLDTPYHSEISENDILPFLMQARQSHVLQRGHRLGQDAEERQPNEFVAHKGQNEAQITVSAWHTNKEFYKLQLNHVDEQYWLFSPLLFHTSSQRVQSGNFIAYNIEELHCYSLLTGKKIGILDLKEHSQGEWVLTQLRIDWHHGGLNLILYRSHKTLEQSETCLAHLNVESEKKHEIEKNI